jgi:ferredoxin-NADP reductase
VYASANLDERKFENPTKFDVTRDVHDHVGFGQGVHMCMGMHLARREMILLLEALRRRVERFELLGEPTVAMNNTIRAFSHMPIKVHLADEVLEDSTTQVEQENPWLDVVIAKREVAANNVISLELAAVGGEELPAYEAGAHIDVFVKSGLIRQYSLTGDASDRSKYRLGILLDDQSRGGSSTIHETFKEGESIRIGRPRNNFPIQPAAHTLLFAGGIGVTPMLNMAYALEASGASWELHYCGRTLERLAFKSELERFGDKVHVHISSGAQEQKLDVNAVMQNPTDDRHLYVCGPNGFMDYIVEAAQSNGWNADCTHLERFGAEVDTDGEPFTVIAQKSGKQFEVLPGETITEKLADIGIEVNVSCQSGVCGTCLTNVVDGVPDHRDFVQTDVEKASNRQITVCCSRSKSKTLVLDI